MAIAECIRPTCGWILRQPKLFFSSLSLWDISSHPSEGQAKAAEAAMREQQYNLARVYLDSRRYAEAQPILNELTMKWPDQPRFAQHLAQCYLALGRREEAKTLLRQLIDYRPISPGHEKR